MLGRRQSNFPLSIEFPFWAVPTKSECAHATADTAQTFRGSSNAFVTTPSMRQFANISSVGPLQHVGRPSCYRTGQDPPASTRKLCPTTVVPPLYGIDLESSYLDRLAACSFSRPPILPAGSPLELTVALQRHTQRTNHQPKGYPRTTLYARESLNETCISAF
jgi:hypothetical protein